MIDRPDRDRRVIPRWLDPHVNASRPEGRPLPDPAAAEIGLPQADLSSLLTDFQNYRHAIFASDLVSAALPVGAIEEGQDAAEFLLASADASPLARQTATRLLTGRSEKVPWHTDVSSEEATGRIRFLRKGLADDPGNALAWAEMARLYALRGQKRPSMRAMSVALGLAPNDRYILRSAARLWVHSDDPERAHKTILSSPRSATDPWLIAAEIGLADLADRRSRLIKRGRSMLDGLPPEHASELAAALGTFELDAGQERRARRLFDTSLEDPNDNALAQAEWASDQIYLPILHAKIESMTSSYEARALEAAADGRPREATKHASQWLSDEPYSIAAAIFGSYQAAKAGDFAHGAEFARRGLVANPGDLTLLNNLAFCFAKQHRVDEADKVLRRIPPGSLTDPKEVSLTATRGLVAIRRGNRDEGLRLYRQAIENAVDPTTKAIALVMMAVELVRVDPDAGLPLAEEASERIRDVSREASTWVRHLQEVTAAREELSPDPAD